jgi:CheY-like chemotaxis protein
MEAIGTVAAGVAHDLNNILTGMVGIPDLMLMDLRDDSPLKDDILAIKKSGQKAAAVVHDLLNLARRNVADNTIVDVGAIANEYLNSPEHKNILEAHSDIEIITDIQPGRHMILGSRVHLSKALMNLVSNAAESISDHGTITISLHSQIIDPPKGEHRDFKKGKYVVMQVQDSGEGIPGTNLEHIFEPFYTTKMMGRSGSGLGLTVVSETVKDHNGHIRVQSRVGEGSTFKIYIPSTDVGEERTNESTSINSYHGNGESILIVDDMESQRDLLKRILENLGYSATTASSGEDAVEYMKNNTADLLILDMIMSPGIDGLDTFKQVVQSNPGQKAILASGYSEPLRLTKLQTIGIEVCIQKPYTAEQIGKAVRAELDR